MLNELWGLTKSMFIASVIKNQHWCFIILLRSWQLIV